VRQTRHDAYVEGWMLRGKRAPCGHLAPCACVGVETPCCGYCPLPDCRYVYRRGLAAVRTMTRSAAIVAMRADGASIQELIERAGVGRRAVFRALARGRCSGDS
jgi:hypothetical protein